LFSIRSSEVKKLAHGVILHASILILFHGHVKRGPAKKPSRYEGNNFSLGVVVRGGSQFGRLKITISRGWPPMHLSQIAQFAAEL